MKTVKNSNGDVKRVDEGTATNLVNSGVWSFCPKSEYRGNRKKTTPNTKSEDDVDLQSRGLSDKKLRKERRLAKSNKK